MRSCLSFATRALFNDLQNTRSLRAARVSFTYGIPTTYDLPPMTKPPHPTSTCLVCYYSLLCTTTDYDLLLRITMYGSAQVHTTIYCLPLTDTYCYLRLLTTMYLITTMYDCAPPHWFTTPMLATIHGRVRLRLTIAISHTQLGKCVWGEILQC